jgi:aryl carrier-like protein
MTSRVKSARSSPTTHPSTLLLSPTHPRLTHRSPSRRSWWVIRGSALQDAAPRWRLANNVLHSRLGSSPVPLGRRGAFHGVELEGVEEIIASVLAEIAGVPKEEITRVTTLFHLGLDSISAIKVSSALKKKSISLYVSCDAEESDCGKYGQGSSATQPVYQDNIEQSRFYEKARPKLFAEAKVSRYHKGPS